MKYSLAKNSKHFFLNSYHVGTVVLRFYPKYRYLAPMALHTSRGHLYDITFEVDA